MCSLFCQLAQSISGYLCVRLCAVDVPVLMLAYCLTPQDASFFVPYVMMTALANYYLGDNEEEECVCNKGW